jgi:exodeoxyribonuclease VII small subunit
MTESPRPSFEEDLRRLEEVVDELEHGEPELLKALARYEEGVGLLARCQGTLERAERSVASLTGLADDGTPKTTPFDAAATPSASGDRPALPVEPPF